MRWLNWTLTILFFWILPFHWLMCRLTARRCPRCASKWQTELVGEWDGEEWVCHCCDWFWIADPKTGTVRFQDGK